MPGQINIMDNLQVESKHKENIFEQSWNQLEKYILLTATEIGQQLSELENPLHRIQYCRRMIDSILLPVIQKDKTSHIGACYLMDSMTDLLRDSYVEWLNSFDDEDDDVVPKKPKLVRQSAIGTNSMEL